MCLSHSQQGMLKANWQEFGIYRANLSTALGIHIFQFDFGRHRHKHSTSILNLVFGMLSY